MMVSPRASMATSLAIAASARPASSCCWCGRRARRGSRVPGSGLSAAPRIGVDGRAEILRHRRRRRGPHRRVGRTTAVGFREVDLRWPGGASPRRREARDVVATHLAHALGAPWRVALEKRVAVEALADAVDPAPAEHDVERLDGGDGRRADAFCIRTQISFSARDGRRSQASKARWVVNALIRFGSGTTAAM